MFERNLPYNELPDLPPKETFDTASLNRLTIKANKLLAELKGFCQTLPNPEILLNTIVLQESKDSNEIENIVTTQDDLYMSSLKQYTSAQNSEAKEVLFYREALYYGIKSLEQHNLITTNTLIGIVQHIKSTTVGVRTITGVKIANPATKEVIYTPPEGERLVLQKLLELERFINDSGVSDLDPLIKMALIHYQFEAIHPFSDGNGRTGRILNILYLIQQDLITLPVLYLSKYIIQNKKEYYTLLRDVTEQKHWVQWVEYVLEGVATTSANTLRKIRKILDHQTQLDEQIKTILGNSASRELTELLTSHPYCKIRVLVEKGIAKRQTASEYLKKLSTAGILVAQKNGKDVYYINQTLMDILSQE
jgi:Fic family protein